jgi:TPR repeat protein
LIFILLFSSSINDDYQTGLDAYTIGDYQTAMKKWTAVVEGPATAVDPLVYIETHYAIAMLYWQGQGVPRDFRKSYEWLLKAANLNHAGAQTKLGYLYTDGVAVPRDFNMAFEWYSKAAKQGDIDGQYNLGIFYLNGWGTEQDTTMAKMYLAAASALGDEAAGEALLDLIPTDEPIDKSRMNSLPRDVETPPLAGANSFAISDDETPIRDETWILSQNPDRYTIQVIGLSTIEKLKALINGHDNLAPFAIYTVQRSSSPIQVLIQGSYADVDAARTARDIFPREINPPDKVWIRQFGKIQELIAAEGMGDG